MGSFHQCVLGAEQGATLQGLPDSLKEAGLAGWVVLPSC
jgi:hypothetical protein